MKPWVHLFVSQEGTVGPCCLAPWSKEETFGDINQQNIREIWNGSEIKSFRKQLLKDRPDSRCSQCYENEKMGLRSRRNQVNFLYSDYLSWALETSRDGTSLTSRPIYWDIRISNLCNLKCRICGHHSSSSWYDDAKQLGESTHPTKIHRGPKDFDELMAQLDDFIDDLEELYFAGGEPTIMPEHLQLLNRLIEKKKFNVKLRYNTNFSQITFKDTNLLKLWNQFEDVFIHASLDDIGDRGMLQRNGLSWDRVVANRNKMIEESPNIDFMLTPTISILNIFHLFNFHKEWVEAGYIQIDEFIPHVLKRPEHYNVRILPAGMKAKAKALLEDHVDWIMAYIKDHPPAPPTPQQLKKWGKRLDMIQSKNVTGHVKLDMLINELQNCITYMNSSDESHMIPEFIKVTEQLDELRNENAFETIPELRELATYGFQS